MNKAKILFFAALIAFELFNFSTTKHGLTLVLGDESFLFLRWSTWLAFALSGFDFAGIAEFANENSKLTSWQLVGAWLFSALTNGGLTMFSPLRTFVLTFTQIWSVERKCHKKYYYKS